MQAKSYASFLRTVQRERAQSTLPKRNIAIKVVDYQVPWNMYSLYSVHFFQD